MERNSNTISKMELMVKRLLLAICLLCHTSHPAMCSHFSFHHHKQAQFANDLSTYEISFPQKVTENGEFVSHSVHHKLEKNNCVNYTVNNPIAQFKTDTAYSEDNVQSECSLDRKLHYKLELDGNDLYLVLEPNDRLIAPGFLIESRNEGYKNLSHAQIKEYPQVLCHFVGQVKGDIHSRVALGTCSGLHGFIHTKHGHYLIEPVLGHNITSGSRHPHLVYKREALPTHLDILKEPSRNSPLNRGQKYCGVDDDYTKSEKEREIWGKENKESIEKGLHENNVRQKRSISQDRYVEVMVVVDKEMMDFYRNEDLHTYVITIMNMVSMMYHDVSIGNAIHIVLVNMMMMDYEEKRLKITHNAEDTLKNFCKWQQSINTESDKDPTHHDVGILLTRRNICSKKNEPCSTLGLSQVNGLCQPHRSCNINEDTGLSLAYTVAHELGHNFGMQHDGKDNGCEAEDGKFQLVMSAQLNAEASPMIWSTCSRKAVTKFLDRDWGYCLNDEPKEVEYFFDGRPPGVKYSADHQCRLQYGEGAVYCEGIDNLCTTLWCRVESRCLTRLEAAAEGTICGDNQWCSGGRCVDQEKLPLPQNGEWGQWASWTECSRSCGAGVAYRERHCNNPKPRNGGKYCMGERKRYRICNTHSCPEDTPSFKDTQCRSFNDVPYKGKYYKWEYVANPRTPCQLHCRPKGHFFSVLLSDMVKDGTSCPIKGAYSMCISGLCRQVGCDWEIDSDAREDACGVCRGDGSTCKTVKSKFDKVKGLGYEEAMVIPEGARNIRIEEMAETSNYLAVRNDHGEYYLNGGWFIQWNGDYEAAGTVMTYERIGDKEILKAPGPLLEPLHVMLLFQSENPGVEFEFTVPSENATEEKFSDFKWIYLDWTHCTESCGGGTQKSHVVCSNTELGVVNARYCNSSTKPEDMLRVCNDQTCPPRWWPGPWQHCSISCGGHSVRHRTVLCVRSSGYGVQEALEDWECNELTKPPTVEKCNVTACPVEGQWQVGAWSKCSLTCGGGIQTRDIVCPNGYSCRPDQQPLSERMCNHGNCSSYMSDQKISTVVSPQVKTDLQSDEKAHRTRAFTNGNATNFISDITNEARKDCSNSEQCNKMLKSNATFDTILSNATFNSKSSAKTSNMLHRRQEEKGVFHPYVTTQYAWMASDWGECSRPCGGGKRTRIVQCVNNNTLEDVKDKYCVSQRRPSKTELCNVHSCLQWTVGEWSECSKTCDNGHKTRQVQCMDLRVQTQSSLCPRSSRPAAIQRCTMSPCPLQNEARGNNVIYSCHSNTLSRHVCNILKKMGRCTNQSIYSKCCHTCQSIKDKINKKHSYTSDKRSSSSSS